MERTEKIVPEDRITHPGGANRGPVGWIAPHGEGFVTVDLPGRGRSETADWLKAGETLNELDIRHLTTPYKLVAGSDISEIYIAEATPDFVHVKGDDFNDINSDQTFCTLPFPVPEGLLQGLSRR